MTDQVYEYGRGEMSVHGSWWRPVVSAPWQKGSTSLMSVRKFVRKTFFLGYLNSPQFSPQRFVSKFGVHRHA